QANEIDVDFTLTSILGVTGLGSQFSGKCHGRVTSISWDLNGNGNVDATSNAPKYTYTLSACASEVRKVIVCVELDKRVVCRFEKWIVLNNPNVAVSHTITPTI